MNIRFFKIEGVYVLWTYYHESVDSYKSLNISFSEKRHEVLRGGVMKASMLQ